MDTTRAGVLFIVASPSGGGKTTLIRQTMARLEIVGVGAHFSISHTTRSPRSNEEDGVHYHFVARDDFESMVGRGDFLEWAEYAGNLYGTSRLEVEDRLRSGVDVFLDIDGRIEDYVLTPEGRLVGRLDHVFKEQYEIEEAQIVQDDPSSIDILVVAGGSREKFDYLPACHTFPSCLEPPLVTQSTKTFNHRPTWLKTRKWSRTRFRAL